VITEVDRPWLFALRLVAALAILVFVSLDFVAVLRSDTTRPMGWFFKVRCSTRLLSFL
jgi:hypothetical protein